MKTWKRYWMGLALAAGLASRLQAQAPIAAPPLAAPPLVAPPLAPAPAVVAPVAPGPNLWSFLCPTPAQKAACKLCFCNSVLGKMVSSMMGPVSVFSGGLFESRCPAALAAAGLALPPDSAEGA